MDSKTTNNIINKLKEVRELFNKVRDNLSRKETKTETNFTKKRAFIIFLKEQTDTLTDKEKIVLKNIGKYLKKLNNDLKKLQNYQDNITYGLDYLFNELSEEDYYEPKEIKSAFDASYMLYESRGDKGSKLALYEYFDKIKPYLKDMINDYKSKGEWKIQIIMKIVFGSLIDKIETQVMHTKSDNIEIMNGIDTNDVINELIDSFMKRYQEGLEAKMKESSYIFEHIDLLEYHLHKISLNRGSSYIESHEWIKIKE